MKDNELLERITLDSECTGPDVARWLSAQGHEVFSVYDEARGASDLTN
jgi:TusA-related sulfurtransferase